MTVVIDLVVMSAFTLKNVIFVRMNTECDRDEVYLKGRLVIPQTHLINTPFSPDAALLIGRDLA